LADNLDRFLNKHKRCHKHIIESEAWNMITRNYKPMKMGTTLTYIQTRSTHIWLKHFFELISFLIGWH
jgi:hypothetical protein